MGKVGIPILGHHFLPDMGMANLYYAADARRSNSVCMGCLCSG